MSLSTFAYLFSEFVQYSRDRSNSVGDLEKRCYPCHLASLALYLAYHRCIRATHLSHHHLRLESAGSSIGVRMLELVCYRDKNCRRETRLLGVRPLQYMRSKPCSSCSSVTTSQINTLH